MTKYEMELIKIINCFFDSLGNYVSNLVSFQKHLYNKYEVFATVSKTIQ